jgi:hypothetical protein
MQSEYDTVMKKFTKSGTHQISFTRAPMKALDDNGDETNDDVLNADDEVDGGGDDDDFGVESGGWRCFTNYLRVWLNKRPILTSFVSRKIPDGVQLDTTKPSAKQRLALESDPTKSDNKKQKKVC